MTITPPPDGPGVGAWKQPRSYASNTILPLEPYSRQRATWAIAGLQRALIDRGYLAADPVTLDGRFGPRTESSVRHFQYDAGCTVDGVIGPVTARRLFLPYFIWWQAVLAIPDNLAYGLAGLESGYDPGAEGSVDNRDRGITQLNRRWHPEVSDAQAYGEPMWCIAHLAATMSAVHADLASWPATIAYWNNPVKAKQWATTGVAPDDLIATYVHLVYAAAGRPA